MNKKTKPRDSIRSESIAIKFSKRELQDLDAIVAKSGLTRSSWVRVAVHERMQQQKMRDWFEDE